MMNLHELSISFADQNFILNNKRSLYWKEQNAIIISDLHIGKAAHFRKHGIALPAEITVQDLNRLQQIVNHYSCYKLIIVGDVLHAGSNSELKLFTEFRESIAKVKCVIIKGNHDKKIEKHLQSFDFEIYNESLMMNNIFLTHHPFEKDSWAISGHIHPGIKLKMGNKQKLSLPCFAIKNKQLILPAFSEFSGLDTKSIHGDVAYYPFYDNAIFKL